MVAQNNGSARHSALERNGEKMFQIDASVGGESGPFLSYKNRAGQGMPDGSWFLREKDADDWHYTDMTDRFKSGFVFDLFATHAGELGGTLKLGYIKFNEGAAADKRFWSSPLKSEPRPDESKTALGSFVWQNLATVRVAVGGGNDALFDVAGWSGYKGVMSLLQDMNGGFAGNVGKCPLVKYTGFRVEGQGNKRLHVPEFSIASWVDRPACLRSDAPVIQATPAPAPAAAPAPTPAPVAATMDDDIPF